MRTWEGSFRLSVPPLAGRTAAAAQPGHLGSNPGRGAFIPPSLAAEWWLHDWPKSSSCSSSSRGSFLRSGWAVGQWLQDWPGLSRGSGTRPWSAVGGGLHACLIRAGCRQGGPMQGAPQAGAPEELEGLLPASFLRGPTWHSVSVARAGAALLQAGPSTLPRLPRLPGVTDWSSRAVQGWSRQLVVRLQQLPRGCAEARVQVRPGCCEAGAGLCCFPPSPHACATCCALSWADPLGVLRGPLGLEVSCWGALGSAGGCCVVSSAGLLDSCLGRLASCGRALSLAVLMPGLGLDRVPQGDSLEA